jgi:hypothetical protein
MSDEAVMCPLCGFPLYKGNVKKEKREGKRTRRIHRVCPTDRKSYRGGLETKEEHKEMHDQAVMYLEKLDDALTPEMFLRTVVGIIDYIGQPYRFFIRSGDVERIKRAACKGVTLQVEVHPVHESIYEAAPEAFEDFTEIKMEESL